MKKAWGPLIVKPQFAFSDLSTHKETSDSSNFIKIVQENPGFLKSLIIYHCFLH